MSATLQPIGMLRSYIADEKEVSVDTGITVSEAISRIGIDPNLVAGVFVNGDLKSKDYILRDGDVVKLLAVIGGG